MTMEHHNQATPTLEISGDGVAWIVFDSPSASVNILTAGVLSRLNDLLGEIETAARAGRVRGVVVRSGKDRSFIAGADVNAIAAVTDPAEGEAAAMQGQGLFRRLDLLPVPTVAAIDGLCLGGGTELVLACDARIASDRRETRIGLPEVKLGIIPGFGGTTRLPRLVGLREALAMILTGSNVSARKAQRIGLISERMHPGILYERAHALALELAASGDADSRTKRSLVSRLLDDTALGRRVILAQARPRSASRRSKGPSRASPRLPACRPFSPAAWRSCAAGITSSRPRRSSERRCNSSRPCSTASASRPHSCRALTRRHGARPCGRTPSSFSWRRLRTR
jgi:3-hydroxyacyl-CoA dehydrogenase/enoyl-CoA hydratase/3-hydroxybutyryl-CoA epimerase